MIQYDKSEKGIVTLTIDMPDRSTNVLNEAFLDALADAIDQLQADEGVRGVILTSGKALFVAGADIDTMFASDDAKTYFEGSQALKALFRRLETLSVPVVAALNGTALGGGFGTRPRLSLSHRPQHSEESIWIPRSRLGAFARCGRRRQNGTLVGIGNCGGMAHPKQKV